MLVEEDILNVDVLTCTGRVHGNGRTWEEVKKWIGFTSHRIVIES